MTSTVVDCFNPLFIVTLLQQQNVDNNSSTMPLIGKDGDDVIDNITCELTGTESINTQTEYTYLCGKMCPTLLIYVEIKAELTKINLT